LPYDTLKNMLPAGARRLAGKTARALRSGKFRAERKVRRSLNGSRHRLGNLVRRKPEKHIVICGFARSGSTMLYQMMRSSAHGLEFFDQEVMARNTRDIYAPAICTKRPLDIFDLDAIRATMPYRDFRFIVMVRDPRSLLSSCHSNFGTQFFQGGDYMMCLRDGIRSFTLPGVLPTGFRILEEATRPDVLIVRYENLVRDPEAERKRISEFCGVDLPGRFGDFHESVVPCLLQAPLNGVRPVEVSSEPEWLSPPRLARVALQYDLFPELDDLCRRLGYADFKDVLDDYGKEVPRSSWKDGTVVAFHTSDALYTSEAERFTARLDVLGLPFEIVTVPPRAQWAENCAIKPKILRDLRSRLFGPLLYTDVDAYFHRSPWINLRQHGDCDIAACITSQGELLSGTILVNDTPGARRALDMWTREQNEQGDMWDQRTLQNIVEREEMKPVEDRAFRFERLAPTLTWIFDRQERYLFGNPIIEHLQVSREVKTGAAPRRAARRQRLRELFEK